MSEGSSPVERHLTLILSLGAFVLTSLKLMSVAHGDMQSVMTILKVAGWASVPSLMVTLLPAALLVAAGVVSFDLAERIRERDELGRLPNATVVLVLLAGIAGQRSFVLIFVVFGSTFFALSFIGRRFLHPANPRKASLSFAGHIVITGIAGLCFAALSPTPWIPNELVTVNEGDPVSVYVLGESGSRTALLMDDTRSIRWVNSDEILDRAVCPQNVAQRPLLASLIWRTEIKSPSSRCD